MSDASMDARAATISTDTEPTPDDNAAATETQPTATPTGKGKRQYNKHDAKAAQERCNALLQAIAGHGRQVNVPALVTGSSVHALTMLLIRHGVIDEHELETERLGVVEASLAEMLTQIEVEKLGARQPCAAGASAAGRGTPMSSWSDDGSLTPKDWHAGATRDGARSTSARYAPRWRRCTGHAAVRR